MTGKNSDVYYDENYEPLDPEGKYVDTTKTGASFYSNIVEPEVKLSMAILAMAKDEASKGSMPALSFLITEGVKLESTITPTWDLGARHKKDYSIILNFCHKVWDDVKAGKLKPIWDDDGITEQLKEYLQNDDLTLEKSVV